LYKRLDTVSFRDYLEFYDAMGEPDIMGRESDWVAGRRETQFASIRYEIYRLFGFIDLEFCAMLPHANIDFHYELGPNYFEIGYVTEGSFHLETENYSDSVICPAHLYVSPPSGSRGRIIYYKDRALRKLSFFAHRADDEATRDVLGESGGQLWAEVVMAGKEEKSDLYPLITPPPHVINALIHAANCNYPHRVRRLFFENIFREILLRLIAHGLPEDKIPEDMDKFEMERIKSVPGILMERLDSPPSIPELARELSINSTRLKIGFKKIFGKPIYSYHRDACLERAALMLLDTNRSVCEIASDAGYSGGGNFTNAFKKRYGVSPSRYRRKDGFL
jgi:AraC-like DNA-binding protein